LEYCKLLLNLDLEDPLFILFIIDYYAIRSQQYEYIFKLYCSPELSEKRLCYLPNFCYSIALAKFYLENGKNTKETLNSLPIKTSADELLRTALLMFPMVLVPLCKKASLNLVGQDKKDLTLHPFFSETCPRSLTQLVTLFVERNYSLWKGPDIDKWLKDNVIQVIQLKESKDPMASNYATVIKEEYSDSSQNVFNHILLSEYADTVQNALPPDLIEAIRHGGPQLYNAFHQVPQPVVHAPTNNPIGLFLSSLLPWNPIPNAPAVESNDWYHQLVDFLHGYENNLNPNPNANPNPNNQNNEGGME